MISCISVENPHGVKVWKNANSDELWPTAVAFTSGGIIFGRKAISLDLSSPENTITNVKGFLGRPFEHEHVQDLIKRKPYRVVRFDNSPSSSEHGQELGEPTWGNVMFEIPHLSSLKAESCYISPIEVASCFLRHLRDEILVRYP